MLVSKSSSGGSNPSGPAIYLEKTMSRLIVVKNENQIYILKEVNKNFQMIDTLSSPEEVDRLIEKLLKAKKEAFDE